MQQEQTDSPDRVDPITVRTFVGGILEIGVDSLIATLGTLSDGNRTEPLLVNLYNASGDLIVVGVGSDYTSLQMIPYSRDINTRSMGCVPAAPQSVPYVYQGQLTEVFPRHLVVAADGYRAAARWLGTGVLDAAIRWSVQPMLGLGKQRGKLRDRYRHQ